MFRAELTKLKRSSTWIIAFVLPTLAVVTGTINYTGNRDTLTSEWTSLTSQVTLFYGLLFYSMGISLLAATVWRMEHRGTNWNLLLTTTVKPIRLVVAKMAVILLPVAFMQIVLLAGTAISGTFIVGLDGTFPLEFALVCLISILAALPLITVQSLLSMLLRSFAAPVALCLLGCVIGVASVTSAALRPLGHIFPQAISARALALGSVATTDASALSVACVLPLLVVSFVIAAVIAWLSVLLIRMVKLR